MPWLHTDHLAQLRHLDASTTTRLVDMLGTHFVRNETLDRPTLLKYAAEAEAVSK